MPTSCPLPDQLDLGRVPAHVAWVASSGPNRSTEPGPTTLPGGRRAVDAALSELVEGALAIGVRWLTVHAPATTHALATTHAPGEEEPGGAGCGSDLMSYLGGHGDDLGRRGVRTRILGTGWAGPSPDRVTAEPSLTLTLTAGYSGRAEVVTAIRHLADEVTAVDEVDEQAIARHLYLPDMPDPDVVVRTGGDRRVSDLLLWESAYSELVFLDDPWPAIHRGHLYDAVVEYEHRVRRYGGLVAANGGGR